MKITEIFIVDQYFRSLSKMHINISCHYLSNLDDYKCLVL